MVTLGEPAQCDAIKKRSRLLKLLLFFMSETIGCCSPQQTYAWASSRLLRASSITLSATWAGTAS